MTGSSASIPPSYTISIAPMMDWTTPAQRYFMRCITRHALLYTEMVTTAALIHGDTQRFLAHDPAEHPVALQLGGNTPKDMAYCARLAADAGFDEVNINVGCPSDRVQDGAFGACMMDYPQRIADCVAAMKAQVNIPVTVKTRIGIDHKDSYDYLRHFTTYMAQAQADHLIVHARKAWLSGLSPRENRQIPPLDYAHVHRLAREFTHLPISINGGIADLDTAAQQLAHVHGVMIGRQAYRQPFSMATIDQHFFHASATHLTRADVVEAMKPYISRHMAAGGRLKDITRHMLGLFHGQPGGRAWRRILSEQGSHAEAGLEVLDQALAQTRL